MLWIKILSYFKGKCVGFDSQGNRYYSKITLKNASEKRWVLYKNKAEPSLIPAAWHGWLHFTLNEIPSGVSNTLERTPADFNKKSKNSFSSTKTPLYSSLHQQGYVAWSPPHKRNKS